MPLARVIGIYRRAIRITQPYANFVETHGMETQCLRTATASHASDGNRGLHVYK